ncbi:MAG: hypothetical protein R3C39_11815 [Dehalococcoidia bacterium]
MRRTTTALLGGLALLLAACTGGSEATSTPSPSPEAAAATEGASSTAPSAANATSSPASSGAGVRAATGEKSPAEAAAQIEVARRAAEVAFAQQTMHYDFAMSIGGIPDFPGGAMTFSGEGATDLVSGRSHMSMDFSSLFDALRYELTAAEAAELDAMFGNGTFEVVTDGTTTYMYAPFFGTAFGVDTPWISMAAPTNAVPLEGLQGSGLENAFAYGPNSFLPLLDLLDSFEEVGFEDVRGVPTTHWAGTLSFEKLFELIDPSMQSQLEWQYEQMGMFDFVLPLEVWVDSDGLTRRFAMNLDLGVFDPSAAGARFEFRYDFFDFGVPVDVTLPSPGEVTDVTELMTSGFGF